MPVGEGFDLPPGSEPWSAFHWFRPSVRGGLLLVVLSEGPIHYTGHYAGDRMVPCCSPRCRFCEEMIGVQVHYVFAVAEVVTRRCGLFEVGAAHGEEIEEFAERAGDLRGIRLLVTKESPKSKSRTILKYEGVEATPWYLALPAPDVKLALYLTWLKSKYPMPEDFRKQMEGVAGEKARAMKAGSEKAEERRMSDRKKELLEQGELLLRSRQSNDRPGGSYT